ncbi:MAG: sugar phosphate isomerase/epimerase family protein [Bacteroidota bacterium]
MKSFQRRKFLQSLALTAAATGISKFSFAKGAQESIAPANKSNRFKISLNAYSFNNALVNKKTTLEEVMEFCARENFDAIDITGYYMPGYPEIPSDEYIYHIKNKAHRLGLAISGTGIRNEFAEPDATKRTAEISFVKKWIEVAAKLGAPVIRIFTGKALPANHSWEEVEDWIVEAIKNCVAYGEQHGVIVAIQNHNDFIKTADQAISILKKVNSKWFGLVLDTGSFVTEEPYNEISKTTSYAVNWQIKEKLNYNGKTEDMDLNKLCGIIQASTYRGYLPIETLSPGDPFTIVPPFLQKVRTALEKAMKGV